MVYGETFKIIEDMDLFLVETLSCTISSMVLPGKEVFWRHQDGDYEEWVGEKIGLIGRNLLTRRYNDLSLWQKMELRGSMLMRFSRFLRYASPHLWTSDERMRRVQEYIYSHIVRRLILMICRKWLVLPKLIWFVFSEKNRYISITIYQ